MIKGLSIPGLGHPMFPIKTLVALWPPGFALWTLDGFWEYAFGDPSKNIREVLDSGNCPAFGVSVWAVRNGQPHTFCPSNLLQRRAGHFNNLAKFYPHVKAYLSHTNEYPGVSLGAIKNNVRIIRKFAPLCTPVNNPMPGSPIIPGMCTEFHGDTATALQGNIASTDGSDATTTDMRGFLLRNSHAELVFGWSVPMNMGDSSLPPSERHTPPTATQIHALINAMTI